MGYEWYDITKLNSQTKVVGERSTRFEKLIVKQARSILDRLGQQQLRCSFLEFVRSKVSASELALLMGWDFTLDASSKSKRIV